MSRTNPYNSRNPKNQDGTTLKKDITEKSINDQITSVEQKNLP